VAIQLRTLVALVRRCPYIGTRLISATELSPLNISLIGSQNMIGTLQDGSFDKTPPVSVEKYDTAIRSFCGAYEEIFKLSYCCLKATLQQRARILVVGAGTGVEIAEFALLSHGWSFHGIDPSGKMLSLARKKYQRRRFGTKFV
jgi:SAM-dependent methyltransferase